VAITHAGEAPPLRLFWEGVPPASPAALRFTVAVDHRCPHRVIAANSVTGERLGACEVPFGCPGQVFEIPLASAPSAAALRDGISLGLDEAAEPLWIVAPGPHAPPAILPQLYFGGGSATEKEFLDLFCSEASMQPCDWMGICVLDGLMDHAVLGRAAARNALHQHLDIAFHPETGRRENFRGEPCDGAPGGPETTGPWAVLARTPGGTDQHAALALAEAGFEQHYDPRTDSVGHRVVAETSYNIAYPMMAMARFTGRPHLQQRALRQLEANRHYLTAADDFWLRYAPETGERTFQNWSRGVAWYFLGLVRTLTLLPVPERPATLTDEIRRIADWVTVHQQADGLWPCFLKETGVLPDTSGSAGIAAALALAGRDRLLGDEHLATAVRTKDALLKQLTPDGWLRGASQSNKADGLQRSPHRVIAPWGMGLFAQLLANLPPENISNIQS
jgi:hypothetical protein